MGYGEFGGLPEIKMKNRMKKINVLSLFAGMNTLELALINQGFIIGKSYASEIKETAIKLMKYHFPKTIQLGDIKKWRSWDIDWSKIDLIGSGSPCQDLSIAGNRKGINGSRSGLFFIFIDIMNHIKKYNPKILFLQENVASARQEDIGIISRELGIKPVRINSALVTAQLRDRYYWTNIRTKKNIFGDLESDIPQPNDRKIYFKDIIESGTVDRKKARALLERYARQTAYKDKGKLHNYLLRRGIRKTMSNYILEGGYYRALTQLEMERLQGFPDGFTSILSREQAGSLLGDAWTLPIIEHIVSQIKKNLK